MGFTRIETLSLTDLFVQQIENMILSGELTVGEQLPPARELSLRMGVSRPVISAGEAEALIHLIPSIQAEACHAPTLQALAQHYRTAVQSHDCRDLIELMMSIYAKRRQAEAQKRRLGMVDERYMKQAEQLLHGELAAALGIPMEEVQPYIARRVSGETPAGTAKG